MASLVVDGDAVPHDKGDPGLLEGEVHRADHGIDQLPRGEGTADEQGVPAGEAPEALLVQGGDEGPLVALLFQGHAALLQEVGDGRLDGAVAGADLLGVADNGGQPLPHLQGIEVPG